MSKVKLFDSHFHIIDNRYPLVPNQGYLPETFTCDDYLRHMKEYTVCGGAVISGSFQAFDQSYLIDALNRLGSSFVGVTQLPVNVSDEELLSLHDAGVRAVRFNIKRGGSEVLNSLNNMALRVYELVGWHVELYIDSKQLSDLYQMLVNLPAVSIDHLGLSKEGLETVIKLAEGGVRIKASGFGRVNFDIKDALKELYSANPESLMFGTDLPSTRAARPFNHSDIELIMENLETEQAINVLYNNAINFYKPKKYSLLPNDRF